MPRPKRPEEEHCQKVSISFDPVMLKELIHYCEVNERTMSWVIRKALAEWLPKHRDDNSFT